MRKWNCLLAVFFGFMCVYIVILTKTLPQMEDHRSIPNPNVVEVMMDSYRQIDHRKEEFVSVWHNHQILNEKLWKSNNEDSRHKLTRNARTSKRKFVSKAVDKHIAEISSKMIDQELAYLFESCLPNTLDTTVYFTDDPTKKDREDSPDYLKSLDSFVITGDIEAIWLRDSTNQVWPYLRYLNEDKSLKNMVRGLINRQVKSVLLDPYSNAFTESTSKPIGHRSDKTDWRVAGTFERKYELDSLVSVVRLSVGYFESTKDKSMFGESWQEAMELIVKTIKENQVESPYRFSRQDEQPTETLLHAKGQPTRECGLSRSPFRPSDDASIFPFLIPANAMAYVWLSRLIEHRLVSTSLQGEIEELVRQIKEGIDEFGVIEHRYFGMIFAYEVDGFGSHYLGDDANVPSLLSLPYLEYCAKNDSIYVNTRNFLLSTDNPWFFSGTVAEGIGSPHGHGPQYIWPMSIIMRALTSEDDQEIMDCLLMIKRSSAGTGFLHESFHKDDASKFTRAWFAWVNTLFGELILRLAEERPHLIFKA